MRLITRGALAVAMLGALSFMSPAQADTATGQSSPCTASHPEACVSAPGCTAVTCAPPPPGCTAPTWPACATAPAEAKRPAPKCKVSVTQAPAPSGFIKVTTTTKCRNITTVSVVYVLARRPGW